MKINSSDNYLRLALRAIDEVLMPEVSSSAAKSTIEILKTTLKELRKREAGASEVLREVIGNGQALYTEVKHALGEQAEPVVEDLSSLSWAALTEVYENLVRQLSGVAEKLEVAEPGNKAPLLRKIAEWELSYYEKMAGVTVVDSANADLATAQEGQVSLDKALLESFLNSANLEPQSSVQLDTFQALPGGFGKQTYMCAYTGEGDRRRELVVRKMDPQPIMRHGACSLEREYALLRALPEDYPAPKPFAYAENWRNVDGDFYVMERSLGDVPGAFLHGMSGEVPEAVFLDLATYLGRLHSLPVSDFATYARECETSGVLDGDTRHAYLRNMAGWDAYIQNEEHLPSPYLHWLIHWLANNIPADERPPVLVHGDFNIHNVLVHEGRISCILDWECAGFGAAEQDLAYIRPHISQHIDWQRFLDHYLEHGGREPREDMMRYGMAYAALRTNLAGNKATLNLQTGRNQDLRYAMVELGFTPSFMQLALGNTD
ncbi:phosphotransferase family protein [Spongiibacter sp. KMU-166]|uniref:Phosphotransferase family protein n=1 Tax=Spongiibacter thalassae TaxID=2721624 RepID=A0ABX1GAQ8_9GAMM|nr:phosphotransferase family protein [Spongiibacter thalassae]NKI16006.1 phosphotransferase family protein [Spongiibacter thalassae]